MKPHYALSFSDDFPTFRLRPTALYRLLLIPTSDHFCPHLKRTAFLVKENRSPPQRILGKSACEKAARFAATASACIVCNLPHLAVLFRSMFDAVSRLATRVRFAAGATFSYPSSPTVLSFLRSINSKEFTHGMDRPAARRNRSELRNQLLR